MSRYPILLTLLGACRIHGHYEGFDADPDGDGDAEHDGNPGDGQTGCSLKVAFDDGVDGARDVWIANPDGSGLVNVSNNSAEDRRPSWSPDGRSILFETNRNGNYDVYFVNVDGSGLRNLTEGSSPDDTSGAWSPDGQRIAFIKGGAVWMMNADGTGVSLLSSMLTSTLVGWSKDGTKVVFEHKPSSTVSAIYAVAAGSASSPVRLSPLNSYAEQPSAAPAEKVVFSGDSSDGFPADIWTVNLDGSGILKIQNGSTDNSPQWTDDGQTIVFSSNRSGRFGVWKMLANGASPMQLTVNTDPVANVRDFVTDVAPSGQLVAFRRVTQQPAMAEIGVIGIDGTGLKVFSSTAIGTRNASNARFGDCPP